MAGGNPFSPTFGASPPLLAGRDDILADFDDALETGPTHPDYTMLFVGLRGTGKTVMLNAVEDIARERGWLTISDNASPPGLIDRLASRAAHLLGELHGTQIASRVTGVRAMGFGMQLEHDRQPHEPLSLRTVLSELGDRLEQSGTGLLITLDEMQSGELDEIREFGAILQHVTRREQRAIAFAGAALPQIERTLLSDEAATFMQRCSRYDIDRLDARATRSALGEPVRERGGLIDADSLDAAVTATSGYAFMVQLVGFHIWKVAKNPTKSISFQDVQAGIAEAERRMGRLVLAPSWQGLSDVDRRFLLVMARDESESRLGDIAERLNVDTGYAGVYRHRLIGRGMIVATGRGRISFSHHATRDWLRGHPDYVANGSL